MYSATLLSLITLPWGRPRPLADSAAQWQVYSLDGDTVRLSLVPVGVGPIPDLF